MKLIIGNKNYSSWSIRPWILMTHFNMTFEEKLIKLFSPSMKQDMKEDCPSQKVPALIDQSRKFANEDIHIWDSLSICEYLNDTYLNGQGWPSDLQEKVLARNMANEMHSGFFGVRNELPMNLRRKLEVVTNDDLTEQAVNDIQRICSLWFDALSKKTDHSEPFLFGKFGIVDAMYFPVVTRFHTYGISIEPSKLTLIKPYMDAMLSLPAFLKWKEAALLEDEVIELDER